MAFSISIFILMAVNKYFVILNTKYIAGKSSYNDSKKLSFFDLVKIM